MAEDNGKRSPVGVRRRAKVASWRLETVWSSVKANIIPISQENFK